MDNCYEFKLTWGKVEGCTSNSFSSWNLLVIISWVNHVVDWYVLVFPQSNIRLLLRCHKINIVLPIHLLTVVSWMLLCLFLSLRTNHWSLLVEVNYSTLMQVANNTDRFVVSNMSRDWIHVVVQDQRTAWLVTWLIMDSFETLTVCDLVASVRHRSRVCTEIARLAKAIILQCFRLILIVSLRLKMIRYSFDI